MLKKQYAKDKKTCKVTFVLSDEVNASNVQLHGDFTKWEKKPVRMKHYKDGNFKASLSIGRRALGERLAGRCLRFERIRYGGFDRKGLEVEKSPYKSETGKVSPSFLFKDSLSVQFSWGLHCIAPFVESKLPMTVDIFDVSRRDLIRIFLIVFL